MTKWVTKKLGEIGDIVTGSTPQTNKDIYWNGEYNFYSPADFTEDIYCKNTERTVTELGLNTGRIIPENSIMVACIASIGKLAINKNKGITNQQINTIIPHLDNDYKFIYYLLLHNVNSIKSKAAQTTIPIINKEDFSSLEFLVPESLAEQRRIAGILSSADGAIAASEALIEKYRNIKRGLLATLLQPKEGWKKVKLGECCEVNPHNTATLPDSFFYIDLESVISGKLIKNQFISKKEAPSRAQRLVLNNDILYQTVRPYQKNNYIFKGDNNQYVASTGYALLRVKNNVDADFIYHLVHTHEFVSEVLGLCTGTSYPAITPSLLNKIEIFVPYKNGQPDLAEQRRIAEILSSVDAKIAAEEKVVEKYKGVKKGLMEELLK